MTTELRIECAFHFQRQAHGAQQVRAGTELPLPDGGVPRVARLMALAIRLDGLVRSGAIKDYTTLARLGQVSTARISQIMNLIHLAPAIQEAILFLPYAKRGGTVLVADLQQVAALPDWARQRRRWHEVCAGRQVDADRGDAKPAQGNAVGHRS